MTEIQWYDENNREMMKIEEGKEEEECDILSLQYELKMREYTDIVKEETDVLVWNEGKCDDNYSDAVWSYSEKCDHEIVVILVQKKEKRKPSINVTFSDDKCGMKVSVVTMILEELVERNGVRGGREYDDKLGKWWSIKWRAVMKIRDLYMTLLIYEERKLKPTGLSEKKLQTYESNEKYYSVWRKYYSGKLEVTWLITVMTWRLEGYMMTRLGMTFWYEDSDLLWYLEYCEEVTEEVTKYDYVKKALINDI